MLWLEAFLLNAWTADGVVDLHLASTEKTQQLQVFVCSAAYCNLTLIHTLLCPLYLFSVL